jgi:hypothetical protein
MKSDSFESSSQESIGLADFELARSYLHNSNFELHTLDKSCDVSTPERCSFPSKLKFRHCRKWKKSRKLFFFFLLPNKPCKIDFVPPKTMSLGISAQNETIENTNLFWLKKKERAFFVFEITQKVCERFGIPPFLFY